MSDSSDNTNTKTSSGMLDNSRAELTRPPLPKLPPVPGSTGVKRPALPPLPSAEKTSVGIELVKAENPSEISFSAEPTSLDLGTTPLSTPETSLLDDSMWSPNAETQVGISLTEQTSEVHEILPLDTGMSQIESMDIQVQESHQIQESHSVPVPEHDSPVYSLPDENQYSDLQMPDSLSTQAFTTTEMPQAPLSGGEDFQTLKKYSALKERELREKDSSLRALQSQLKLAQEKLSSSESERRRVSIALSDLEAQARALQEKVDTHQHQLRGLESQQQEEMRALQLRFESAQFLANKSSKKLDEFRDRVKADIVKIRSRERELANRLEIQKRDAEALLAAKDERLLQQKREIDRLEYELENLNERLVEEAAKADDRVGRLTRAVQSLKLAQGILSGLEEEVLPSVRAKTPTLSAAEESSPSQKLNESANNLSAPQEQEQDPVDGSGQNDAA